MSSPQTASPPEFRLYRRIVTWSALLFVALGTAYLMISVAVNIYRSRTADRTGTPVSATMTAAEASGCWDELDDVTQTLGKHLENFHHLLGGYDPDEAQRWAEEGAVWRKQWNLLGDRCRFPHVSAAAPRLRKELEAMAAVWVELGDIQQVYTNELLRFGKHQAPRLDQVRRRIQKIGERIAASASPQGETP